MDAHPGLPEGWRGEEAQALRFGVWRFWRVVDPDRESSVREDNWVTRDGVGMPGQEGLRTFLGDLRSTDDDGRRRRDSNPRWRSTPHTHLAGGRLQPLGHFSRRRRV